jgi:hypothetical protein
MVVVGFEVLTAVVIKNTVLWDITLCSMLKVGTATCFHTGFLLGLCFIPEDRSDVPRNIG